MFDKRWHLRGERFILYQLAMLISLAAECTATYCLSKYEFHESHIEEYSNYAATVYNRDIIAVAILTIVYCVLVATIFGADFFFLLFWPRRRYPAWYQSTKKGLAVAICGGMLVSAIASTVVVAVRQSTISGVSDEEIQQLVNIFYRPPLVYRRWPQNIAWVVLLWIAFVSTCAATAIMFVSAAYDEKYGTDPKNIIDLNDSNEKGVVRASDEAPIRDATTHQMHPNPNANPSVDSEEPAAKV